MEPEIVILIADRIFGGRLGSLAVGTAVWIVDSPTNHSAILSRWAEAKAQGQDARLTSFVDVPSSSSSELATDMIGTIHEHHPSMSRLEIIGVSPSEALASSLSEYGFVAGQSLDSSVVFVRDGNVPNQSSEPTLASGTTPAGQEPRLP